MQSLILIRKAPELGICVNGVVRTEFTIVFRYCRVSPLPLLKFAILLSLSSEVMVDCLDDRMVNTRNRRAGAEDTQGNGHPPPPLTLAQAIASILES
jgi:hypothetical protein